MRTFLRLLGPTFQLRCTALVDRSRASLIDESDLCSWRKRGEASERGEVRVWTRRGREAIGHCV